MEAELERRRLEREKRAAAKAAADNKSDAVRAAEEKAKMQAYLKQDLAAEKEQFKELHKIHDRVRAADLESWYDALKEYTYPTTFVAISIEDGAAMRRWRDYHRTTPKVPFSDAKSIGLIDGMKARLATALATFANGAFVKLSSRSPKDAVVTCQKTVNLFRQLLAENKSGAAAASDNDKLIAINRAHILALRSVTASDVMDTFLASERIYEDLTLAAEHPAKWSQKFVLRKWIDIPIEYEFRGFVYNNELTALSQYYHFCYFPEIAKRKPEIENKIKTFFDAVKAHVPLNPKEYVVDFAWDVAGDRVYIIELNPFGTYEGMGTSTSMFDKKKDHNILFGSKQTFQFRIETDVPGDIFKIMGDSWKDLFVAEGFAPPPPTPTGTGTGTAADTKSAPAASTTASAAVAALAPLSSASAAAAPDAPVPLRRAPSDQIEHTPKHKQQPPASAAAKQ